jgi:hypothetical protein
MGENAFETKEREFSEFIVAEYLKYGSVDEVFRKNNYSLPISYMGVHRLLDKWGIIKAAGPNSKLSEALTFMVLLNDERVPLERLYRSLPPSFKTSMATMHRILHNIKEDVVRRVGTALVISSGEDRPQILIGEDVSTPRIELGKPFGSISLPMTYSKVSEEPRESILRVLQQEVFTLNAIKRDIPSGTIPESPKPFMYLDIADVRVAVYHISLEKSAVFSSFKLVNHRYMPAGEIVHGAHNFRAGVREIVFGYLKYLKGEERPLFAKSLINLALSKLALAEA